MRRVAVVGNGMSISAAPGLRLGPLTAAVRVALGAIDGGALLARLEEAGALLVPDPHAHHPDTNFEHLLGPLDRLALLFRGPLLQVVGAMTQQQGALQAAGNVVDTIYIRGVGTVLHLVDQAPANDQSVRTVVDWMLDGLGTDDTLSVYTVNYDPFLDRWLLEAHNDANQPNVRLDDEFAALNAQSIKVVTLPTFPPHQHTLSLVPLRPPHLARLGTVHLYHLHGAMHWVTHAGDVWKARNIDDLRQRDVFARWAAGEALAIRPHVILTDQKSRAVLVEPFAQNYNALREDLVRADCVMIAGYSFGDVPLNDVLAATWRRRANGSHWLVVDRGTWIERIAKRARAISAMKATVFASPDFSWSGLPGVVVERPQFWT